LVILMVVLDLDVDLDNNRQSPDGYYGSGVGLCSWDHLSDR